MCSGAGTGRTFTRVENALEEKANDVQDALNHLTLARLFHLRKNLVEIGLRKFQRLRKPHARIERRETQCPSSVGLLPPAPPRRGTPAQSIRRRRKKTLPRAKERGGFGGGATPSALCFFGRKSGHARPRGASTRSRAATLGSEILSSTEPGSEPLSTLMWRASSTAAGKMPPAQGACHPSDITAGRAPGERTRAGAHAAHQHT